MMKWEIGGRNKREEIIRNEVTKSIYEKCIGWIQHVGQNKCMKLTDAENFQTCLVQEKYRRWHEIWDLIT